MTDYEILLLATGINLGVLLMVLANIVFDHIDARRDQRTTQAALNRARKSLATIDWRDALAAQVKA